jgi:hypothetical protein
MSGVISDSGLAPVKARDLAPSLPGHWETPEGRLMAAEYAGKPRADLAYGERTDMEIANRIFMANRHDLDLIHWQEAAKQRIRWLSAQLALADPEASKLIFVPGQWRCAKCGFELTAMNMNLGDGSVTANEKPGERCPNDGSPLWRVTWKADAMRLAERLEEEILALPRRINWPEDGKIPIHEFEQQAGVTIGERFVYRQPKQEEKKMIPKEQADLADALMEEDSEYDRDAAIAAAGRILERFKSRGWKIIEIVG